MDFQRHLHRKAFTLLEVLAVLTIIGIFASLAVYNINGQMKHHRLNQAAKLMANAIGEVRTYCMGASLDNRNLNFWRSRPTRLACSVHVYKGWVNPANPVETGDTWADGGADKEHDLSFSILVVTDIGSDNVYRKESPDYSPSGVADDNLNGTKDLSLILDEGIRARVINLPEGVLIRKAKVGDAEVAATGDMFGSLEYWTYNQHGRLVRADGPASSWHRQDSRPAAVGRHPNGPSPPA